MADVYILFTKDGYKNAKIPANLRRTLRLPKFKTDEEGNQTLAEYTVESAFKGHGKSAGEVVPLIWDGSTKPVRQRSETAETNYFLLPHNQLGWTKIKEMQTFAVGRNKSMQGILMSTPEAIHFLETGQELPLPE